MKRRTFICLLSIIVYSNTINGQDHSKLTEGVSLGDDRVIQEISLLQLLTFPEKYDGKVVSVIGFIHVDTSEISIQSDKRNNCIFLNKEEYDHNILLNAIWIDLKDKLRTDKTRRIIYDKFRNNDYVSIRGQFFNKLVFGETGSYIFRGMIANVELVKVWE